MKKRRFVLLAVSVLILAIAGMSQGAEKFILRVSGQPTLHGLPTWHAIEEGLVKDPNLEIQYLLFASGAPQVEALAAGQWDVGAIGAIPAMMASMRYGALLIGISNDESETNDLWVRPDSPLLKTAGANPKYPDIFGSAADWKGKKILATTVSTGHYALTSTLKALGLKDSDIVMVHMEQGQALAAFGAGEGDIIQLWAPSSYIAESKGWKKVSSGRRAGVLITSPIIVRKEFAEKYPDRVLEWLDIYMNEIEKMKSNPNEGATNLLKYFIDYCGLEMTPEQVAKEFQLRPLFNATEQIDLLANPDKALKWMKDIAQFMLDQGRISQAEYDRYTKANCFIDPKFMKMLAEKRAAKKQ